MPERQIDAATAVRVPTLLLLLTEWLRCSKRAAKTLLDGREVFVNGRRVWMAHHTLNPEDVVRIPDTPSPDAQEIDPRRGEAPPRKTESIQMLYTDECLSVVNKPAGMESTSETGVVEQYAVRTGKTCFPVHRLDRDTSGCLLIAHTEAARDALVGSFEKKEVHKVYEALVMGEIWRPRTIHTPIDGLPAISHIQPVKRYKGLSHVQVEIETGRMHQIRRHLASIGCPILGDKQYGGKRKIEREWMSVRRQMLHASGIALPHPADPARILRIKAPLAGDLVYWMRRFKLGGQFPKRARNTRGGKGKPTRGGAERQEIRGRTGVRGDASAPARKGVPQSR